VSSYRVHKDRPDDNLSTIRKAAEGMGAQTYRWRLVDLVVVFRGQVALWEVKMPGEGLRDNQMKIHLKMKQNGYTPSVVRTVEDVQEELEKMG
jgi:hypothetical protein